MKYKALMLDLDGTTVLSHSLTPSIKVTEAISKVRDQIHVCLATGRFLSQIEPIIDHLHLSGPCVIANGIQIYDPQRKKITREIKLDPKHHQEIYEIVRSYGEVKVFNGEMDIPYAQGKKGKIFSFYLPVMDKGNVDRLMKQLKHLSDVTVHQMTTADAKMIGIEICHVSATKQHGILEVAELLKIKTHEIIGVGDGYNDFPLLMACGLKIAMGNAVPELKAIADFIAPPVEEDGVATVIEKFILNS